MPSSLSTAARSTGLPDFTAALTHPQDGAFLQLGTAFAQRLPATPLPAPYVVGFSEDTARLLGLDPAIRDLPGFAELFCGNSTPSWPRDAHPYATVYSGHQFGVWAGQLGDGRALGLGELEHAGKRHELQLKGSGRTPYSRMGDGRAVLRSSIREFLCSEAMHHLGVPTTRALTVIGSDQPVRREGLETSAVITRVAASFVRFGHFEHYSADNQIEALRALADHVITRFYPHCHAADDPYLALLQEVVLRTADLIARWQSLGFCHGVMNTDNMSILGLTLDYGPFGFIDAFDASYVCNHSDTHGRYAYRMQPRVAHWNCLCLAQALSPLFGAPADGHDENARAERAGDAVQQILARFPERFGQTLERLMRAKLGLAHEQDNDAALANQLLEIMDANRADFTLTFRHLAALSKHGPSQDTPVRELFADPAAFDQWAHLYRTRLAEETCDDTIRAQAMNRVNPKYVLRNHLAETAIRRAHEQDFSEVEQLLTVLRRPFDEQPEYAAYAALPPPWASTLEISCSS